MRMKIVWLAVCALVFTAGCSVLGYIAFRPHPKMEGELTVKGVRQQVIIYRDKFGVPHVLAQTDADAFFGLGFVQAQDRPLLLEVERLAAQGKVAKVIGKKG